MAPFSGGGRNEGCTALGPDQRQYAWVGSYRSSPGIDVKRPSRFRERKQSVDSEGIQSSLYVYTQFRG